MCVYVNICVFIIAYTFVHVYINIRHSVCQKGGWDFGVDRIEIQVGSTMAGQSSRPQCPVAAASYSCRQVRQGQMGHPNAGFCIYTYTYMYLNIHTYIYIGVYIGICAYVNMYIGV